MVVAFDARLFEVNCAGFRACKSAERCLALSHQFQVAQVATAHVQLVIFYYSSLTSGSETGVVPYVSWDHLTGLLL